MNPEPHWVQVDPSDEHEAQFYIEQGTQIPEVEFT